MDWVCVRRVPSHLSGTHWMHMNEATRIRSADQGQSCLAATIGWSRVRTDERRITPLQNTAYAARAPRSNGTFSINTICAIQRMLKSKLIQSSPLPRLDRSDTDSVLANANDLEGFAISLGFEPVAPTGCPPDRIPALLPICIGQAVPCHVMASSTI